MTPKLKEACGVAGVMLQRESFIGEAAQLVYLSLNALQHRGQESAGIASFDLEGNCSMVRDMGLVNQIFNEDNLANLVGQVSVGHVRYSTTGESEIYNAQPITLSSKCYGTFALAHNGNLVNAESLRQELVHKGRKILSTSDSELLTHLIKDECEGSQNQALLDDLKRALKKARGAFSLAISLGSDYLVGVRDPQGIRPLSLGAIEANGETLGLVLSSETCGLDIMGAKFIREIEPGEVILIDRNLKTQSAFLPGVDSKFCLFELVYFARPDSTLRGIQVNAYREELGRELARTTPVPEDADIVISVPDSGTPAAIGYADQSKVTYASGLIKNRYIGRTFIQPTQSMRQLGIRLKLNPLTSVIAGKSVVVIDDSIVRGNTPRQLVKLLKSAGAREVHLRISSPPILWGCFYGVAMKDDELIARRLNAQVELIRAEIGADSLNYLSLNSLLKVTGQDPKSFCAACFNGFYPAGVPETEKDFEQSII
jgi:amidophosphoribosyltransferase